MATTNNSADTFSRSSQMVEYRTKVYEASSLAQNEVVEMIDVKAGEVVVDVVLHYDALGANSSLSVGDGGASARYITTTTTTSAGRTNLNSVADVGPAYKYTANDTIDFTVVGTGAITGTVRVTALILRTF